MIQLEESNRDKNQPGVDDVLQSAPSVVGVQHQVTVPSVELAIRGRVHRNFITGLNAPNLQTPQHISRNTDTLKACYKNIRFTVYLDFPGAIVHHPVLGGHGFVVMQTGRVKGNLLHSGDFANGVGFARAGGLIPVQPVEEEILKQSGLCSCGHDLDLSEKCKNNKKRYALLQLFRRLVTLLPECCWGSCGL